MITRQTLEAFKHGWELQLQGAQADFHTKQGEFKTFMELVQLKPKDELYTTSVQVKQHELNESWKALTQIETAVHVIDNLLVNVDTDEIDLDLQSRLIQMVDGDLMEAIKEAGIE